MERIAEIERFGQGVGDGIEYQQLAVAAADFVLGALSFGNVEKEP